MQLESKHSRFVKMPITVEVEKAVEACSTLGVGIDSYPLKDYAFHSLLLNQTGFLEQKLRCICWDVATEDYDYRRGLLNNEDKLGEYSSLEAKKKIYKRIIGLIAGLGGDKQSVYHVGLAERARSEILQLFWRTPFQYWEEKGYAALKEDGSLFVDKNVGKGGFIESRLLNVYDKLYKARNAYAHNTFSYQEYRPTLRALAGANDNLEDNFFVWTALLNLLDKLFTKLYSVYFNKVWENKI